MTISAFRLPASGEFGTSHKFGTFPRRSSMVIFVANPSSSCQNKCIASHEASSQKFPVKMASAGLSGAYTSTVVNPVSDNVHTVDIKHPKQCGTHRQYLMMFPDKTLKRDCYGCQVCYDKGQTCDKHNLKFANVEDAEGNKLFGCLKCVNEIEKCTKHSVGYTTIHIKLSGKIDEYFSAVI